MHRAVILASFAVFALASSPRSAHSQAPVTGDTIARAINEPAPLVDTASHKQALNARDHLITNCASRSGNPVGYVLPLVCAPPINGLSRRADFDSVTFIRNGRAVTLAARDVHAINLLNHQQRVHAWAGALIGGGAGLVGAAFIRDGGPNGTNHPSLTTALTLGGVGALIGGFSASHWGERPRTLQGKQH